MTPASINSIVLDIVKPESTSRYVTIDTMTTTIRIVMALMLLQMTTGASKKSVITSSRIPFAVRLIKGPE